MKRVFEDAQFVCTWLHETEGVDRMPTGAITVPSRLSQAMDFINLAASDLPPKPFHVSGDLGSLTPAMRQWYDNYVIDKFQSQWEAFYHLLDHQYWTRLWIFQEFIVANQLCLLTKHSYCSIYNFDLFVSATTADILHSARHVNTLQAKFRENVLLKLISSTGTSHCLHRSSYRHEKRVGGTLRTVPVATHLSLLQIARRCMCKEPRDKIFGMLGLVDVNFQQLMAIDYSCTTFEVFAILIRSFISVYKSPRQLVQFAELSQALLDNLGESTLRKPSRVRRRHAPSDEFSVHM